MSRIKAGVIFLAIAVFVAVIWTQSLPASGSGGPFSAWGEEAARLLSGQINGTVQIGRMAMPAWDRVELAEVSVQDSQGQPVADIPRLIVDLRWLPLLKGDGIAAVVGEVRVEQPRIRVRQLPDGRWNVATLAKERTGTDEAAYRGRIRLQGGEMTLGMGQQTLQLEALQGAIDFATDGGTAVALTADPGSGTLAVEAWLGKNSGQAHLKLEDLSVQVLQPLLNGYGQGELTGGQLEKGRVDIRWDPAGVRISGEGNWKDLQGHWMGKKMTRGSGQAIFDNQSVWLDAVVEVDQQPLAARGRAVWDSQELWLDMGVRAAAVDVMQLWSESPLQGRLALQGRLWGPLGGLRIQGQGGMSAASLGEVQAEELQFSFAGEIGSDAQQPLRQLDLEVQAGTLGYRGARLQEAGAKVQLAGEEWLVEGFSARMGEGVVAGQGSWRNGTLQGNVQGAEIQGATFAALGDIPASGTWSFSAELGGTTARPQVTGRLAAHGGQLLQQPFERLLGRYRWADERITLQEVRWEQGTGFGEINGWVRQDGSDMALAVQLSGLRAEPLAQLLAPREPLTGNVEARLQLAGAVADPSFSGKILLTEGSYRGYLLARAEANLSRVQGVLQLRDVTIASLNTQVALNGTVDPQGNMDIHLEAKDIELERLHIPFPYAVGGKASFSGQVSGTVQDPQFGGTLTAEQIHLNGQSITTIRGVVAANAAQVEVPEFSFRQGAGVFRFAGSINPDNGNMLGRFTVDKGEVAALLKILNVPVSGIEGSLAGEVELAGSLVRPDIRLRGTLTQGKIRRYPLESIEVDVALQNTLLTVHRFQAHQGKGILAGRGSLDLAGAIDLEVGGAELDAGLLTTWFDAAVDTKGTLNFTAQVGGTAAEPKAAVSLEVLGGGVSSATFDKLFGLFLVDRKQIAVNQLLLTKGLYRASMYGIVPLGAISPVVRGPGGEHKQQEMDLLFRLDEADLSILPLYSKDIQSASGKTQGEVRVTGTLAKPKFAGGISLQEGTLKLGSLAEPIQKIGLDIRFQGDTMNVNKIEATSGAGTAQMQGTVSLQGLQLGRYDLSLAVKDFTINHRYFKGPLNGDLRFYNQGTLPTLAGKIRFEKDLINIPYITTVATTGPEIALDLDVIIGEKTRFYNPYFYDFIASGQVHFGGTTQNVAPAGRVRAERGTINYLRNVFKIKTARADFIRIGSLEPVIQLSAESRLTRTLIKLEATGPVSELNFRLSSEPQLSQQEIITLLTFRTRSAERSGSSSISPDELLSLLDTGLQVRFISEIENTFRAALGLDEFRVVRTTWNAATGSSQNWGTVISSSTSTTSTQGGTTAAQAAADVNREVYNVEVGKYVTDRLVLTYLTGLDHQEYQIGFRYELNRRVSITASTDDQNRSRIGLEYRRKF